MGKGSRATLTFFTHVEAVNRNKQEQMACVLREQGPPRFGRKCTEAAEETPLCSFLSVLNTVLPANTQHVNDLYNSHGQNQGLKAHNRI